MKTPPKKKRKRPADPENTGSRRPGETPAPAAAERTGDEAEARKAEDALSDSKSSEERQHITNHDEQEKITNADNDQRPEY